MSREVPLTLIVGVGSRMRGDDSVGPFVIDLLKDRMDREGCPEGNRLSLIDADVMPENFTRPIRESGASVCLLVDAVDVKMEPGMIRRIPMDSIDETIPCSHSLPLSYLMKYIGEKIERVELIGIQIAETGLYIEMTDQAIGGGERLAEILWAGDWEKIKVYDGSESPSDTEATNYCW
jgi:hydrogenase 3 maturation protease